MLQVSLNEQLNNNKKFTGIKRNKKNMSAKGTIKSLNKIRKYHSKNLT